jgi:ornithine cyclodeaminase/alanine dehydrogenase-like protein (mu-crystallin family)
MSAVVDMARAVTAVEEALVAEARGQRPAPADLPPGLDAVARGAAAAIASRFLAVGTPRSIGLVGDPAIAAAALAAHRVLFAPRDVRCADEALAGLVGGRAASLEQTFACDIVCVAADVVVARRWLRGGTHVNLLVGSADPAALADAMVVVDDQRDVGAPVYGTLAEIAAGYKDGRQLDEVSWFLAGGLASARLAVAELAAQL